jgi:hypothetical protein
VKPAWILVVIWLLIALVDSAGIRWVLVIPGLLRAALISGLLLFVPVLSCSGLLLAALGCSGFWVARPISGRPVPDFPDFSLNLQWETIIFGIWLARHSFGFWMAKPKFP